MPSELPTSDSYATKENPYLSTENDIPSNFSPEDLEVAQEALQETQIGQHITQLGVQLESMAIEELTKSEVNQNESYGKVMRTVLGEREGLYKEAKDHSNKAKITEQTARNAQERALSTHRDADVISGLDLSSDLSETFKNSEQADEILASRLQEEVVNRRKLAQTSRERAKNLSVWDSLKEEHAKKVAQGTAESRAQKIFKAEEMRVKTAQELQMVTAQELQASRSVIESVQAGGPLSETVLVRGQELSESRQEANYTQLKYAKKLDRLTGAFGERGRSTAAIRQMQIEQQQGVNNTQMELNTNLNEEWDGLVASIGKGEGLPEELLEAQKLASSWINEIIESNGASAIGQEFLTGDNLQEWEDAQIQGMRDPVRKLIFRRMKRVSVEDMIGCNINVSESEGGARVISAEIDGNREDGESVLFETLAKTAYKEIMLRKELSNTEPRDLDRVTALTEMLEHSDKMRTSTLRMANARINGIFVKQSVANGRIQTGLMDVTYKGTRAFAAGVAIFIGTKLLSEGIGLSSESLQNYSEALLEKVVRLEAQVQQAPDMIDQLLQQVSGTGQQVVEQAQDLVGTAAQTLAGGVDVAQQGVSDMSQQLGQVEELNQMVQSAPAQISAMQSQSAVLSQGAGVVSRVGAAVGSVANIAALAGAALSLTFGRKAKKK